MADNTLRHTRAALTAEQRAMLSAPDARMDAYYYSFDRTGVPQVDAILSALAYAGKGLHSTEDWGDGEYNAGYGPFTAGQSYVEVIQAAANEAADALRALTAPPTNDEREALARIMDESDPEMGGVVADEGHESWEWYTPMADAILASDAWRSRRGPITDVEELVSNMRLNHRQVMRDPEGMVWTCICEGWHGGDFDVHRLRAALEAAEEKR